MKLNNETLDLPNIETIVIPRGNKFIILKAQAVLDYTIFDSLCPRPTAPLVQKRGGETHSDDKDVGFIKALDDWGTKKFNWMIKESLKATDSLEWETVKDEDPLSWLNIETELRAAKFTPGEIMHITQCILGVNSLSEERIKEARATFFAQEAQKAQTLT